MLPLPDEGGKALWGRAAHLETFSRNSRVKMPTTEAVVPNGRDATGKYRQSFFLYFFVFFLLSPFVRCLEVQVSGMQQKAMT